MQRDSIDFSSSDVGKLFRRFLFPTVMGMVFSAVFVITDGIFVGRGIGSDALASVNIVAPLFMLGTGLGLMFGMGGSVVASINLAQGKRRVAEINITQSLVLPALLIALLSALLIHWHEPLLLLLGTPGELMVPAREYLALRKNPEYKETIVYGELIPYLEEQHNLMSYYRKGDKTLLVLGNFQKEPQTVKLPSACRKVLLNNYPELNISDDSVILDNYQAVVIEL